MDQRLKTAHKDCHGPSDSPTSLQEAKKTPVCPFKSVYPDGILQDELSITYSPKGGLDIQRSSPVIRPPNYLKGIPKNGVTTLMLVASGQSSTGKDRFVLDTGANIHATGNRNLFSQLTTDKAGTKVKMADGSFLWSHGCGCVITEKYRLPKVHYVPGLDTNVVSIPVLTEEDYTFEFKREKCTIMYGHIQAGSGTRGGSNDLYELDYLRVHLN